MSHSLSSSSSSTWTTMLMTKVGLWLSPCCWPLLTCSSVQISPSRATRRTARWVWQPPPHHWPWKSSLTHYVTGHSCSSVSLVLPVFLPVKKVFFLPTVSEYSLTGGCLIVGFEIFNFWAFRVLTWFVCFVLALNCQPCQHFTAHIKEVSLLFAPVAAPLSAVIS